MTTENNNGEIQGNPAEEKTDQPGGSAVEKENATNVASQTEAAKKQKQIAHRENVVATLFAILGVVTLCGLTYLSLPAFGGISDLPEYYAPAKLIAEGKGALGYTLQGLAEAQHRLFPSMGGRVVPLFVPPPGLEIVYPIAIFSPETARVVWKGVLAFCLAFSIFLLKKTFKLGYKQTCYLIAAVTLSDAAYNSMRIDQLAPILLMSYALSLYCFEIKGDLAAGLWLCLIILKPQQFLPYMAFLAGTKRFKTLIATSCVILVLCITAFAHIGQDGFSNYAALVSAPSSLPYMQPELTPTIRGQLLRFFPASASLIFSITSAFYLATIALAAFVGWKFRNRKNSHLIGVLSIMPLALVTSMHCHTYDLLLLVPTIILIFSEAIMPFGPVWKLAIMLGGIAFMLPLSIEFQYAYLLKGGQFNVWFFLLLPLAAALLIKVFRQT